RNRIDARRESGEFEVPVRVSGGPLSCAAEWRGATRGGGAQKHRHLRPSRPHFLHHAAPGYPPPRLFVPRRHAQNDEDQEEKPRRGDGEMGRGGEGDKSPLSPCPFVSSSPRLFVSLSPRLLVSSSPRLLVSSSPRLLVSLFLFLSARPQRSKRLYG